MSLANTFTLLQLCQEENISSRVVNHLKSNKNKYLTGLGVGAAAGLGALAYNHFNQDSEKVNKFWATDKEGNVSGTKLTPRKYYDRIVKLHGKEYADNIINRHKN